MQNKELYKSILAFVPVVGLLIVAASMPFGYSNIQRTGHYILGIGYVLDYVVNQRWRGWRWGRDKWVYVTLILLFLMLPAWQLWDKTPPTNYFWHQLDRHIMFIAVGVGGILGFSDKFRLQYVGYVMLLVGLYIVGVNTYYYMQYHPMFPFDTLLYNHIRAEKINSHMVINLYMNTAIIIGFWILHQPFRRWVKECVGVAMIVLWCYVLLSVGRAGFITSLLIVGVFGMTYIWKIRKAYSIALSIGIVALLTVLVLQNQRLEADVMLENPRLPVWDYSVRMIAEHPCMGYGVSTMSTEFVEQMYHDDIAYEGFVRGIMSVPEFIPWGKSMMTHHPHNAFLTIWLEFGLFGIITLLLFFVSAIVMPTRDMRLYVWMFLVALFIQMMFEPLGDHLQPQFISVILLSLQLACYPPSVATPCHTDDTACGK